MDPTPPVITYAASHATTSPGGTVVEHKLCVGCGYDLLGLPVTGKCPECGLDVERSLKGDLLQFAGPEYLEKLHTGVVWVQGALIAMVSSMILLVAIGLLSVTFAFQPGATRAALMANRHMIDTLGEAVQVIIALASAWGWWQFSEPDPGQVSTNKGEGPRRWVRITTIAKVAIALFGLVIQLFLATGALSSALPRTAPGAGMPSAASVLMAIAGLASLLNLGVLATWFFASMLYIKWLAERVPDQRSIDRAKRMMWLGPVLMTVGTLACGIGPIVALVLYYTQLEWMRVNIKRIRQHVASDLMGVGPVM